MLDKLRAIEAKYSQIETQLEAPETYGAPGLAARLNKEQAELAPLVETYRRYQEAQRREEEGRELLSDPEMRPLAQEEIQQAREEQTELESQLRLLLLPKDPNDDKIVSGSAGKQKSTAQTKRSWAG